METRRRCKEEVVVMGEGGGGSNAVPPYTDVYAPNSEVNQRPSSKASNLAKR